MPGFQITGLIELRHKGYIILSKGSPDTGKVKADITINLNNTGDSMNQCLYTKISITDDT